MSKKLKKRLINIIIGIVCFLILRIAGHFLPVCKTGIVALILYLVLYVYSGFDVLRKAGSNVIHLRMMDENFLMVLASVGAFFIGSYEEGVAVMLFYQVGEWFQSYAVGKSRKSIKELMNIRPDYAVVVRNSEEITVSPDEVEIGETIVIKPGEKVPLDGVISKGSSSLDTMALTGESVPRDVREGDNVISGCVNQSGVLYVTTSKTFGDSTVAKILKLVETATDKKADSENFITKFARVYTPVIVVLAVCMAVIPALVTGGGWTTWLYRALSFLVISCPCALVISIPLGFFGGIGGASKEGILVKGSCFIEQLAETEIVAMDKTGTLTKGVFHVKKVETKEGISRDELIELAAIAESYSTHPISKSLQEAYGHAVDKTRLKEVREIAGQGIEAKVDGNNVYIGNSKLMETCKLKVDQVTESGTICYVARAGSYLGYIVIGDEEKEDALKCIQGLKATGVKKTVMLTGDREAAAKDVADRLGITQYYSDLLPADKVDIVEKLMQEKAPKKKLVFVGDGINDAPVLARADIGIAMGGLGSDAAIEAADIVIMTDEPSKIAKAIRISRKTLRIVNENIVFAIGVKLLILILAAFGIATMWAAVFADVGVAFIAILNSMRAMKAPKM